MKKSFLKQITSLLAAVAIVGAALCASGCEVTCEDACGSGIELSLCTACRAGPAFERDCVELYCE